MVATLDWHWAEAANHTKAGVVAAVRAARDTITVFGFFSRVDLRKLQCSLDGNRWVAAIAATTIPESNFDRSNIFERYQHQDSTHQWTRTGVSGSIVHRRFGVAIESDHGLAGSRFSCVLGGGARSSDNALLRMPGRRLSV